MCPCFWTDFNTIKQAELLFNYRDDIYLYVKADAKIFAKMFNYCDNIYLHVKADVKIFAKIARGNSFQYEI